MTKSVKAGSSAGDTRGRHVPSCLEWGRMGGGAGGNGSGVEMVIGASSGI